MKDEKRILVKQVKQQGRGCCWTCHKNPWRVCNQWTHISFNWNSFVITEFLVSEFGLLITWWKMVATCSNPFEIL